MKRETSLGRWCGRIIEAGWLLALTIIPIYFNLYSARHFEPDKASVLRSLVLMMAAAGVIRGLEALANRDPNSSAPAQSWWQRLRSAPLALPTLAYSLVFVITTFTSVVPLTSFWGSYQRLQGTYTNLSYVLLGVMVALSMRERVQLERAITVSLAASLVVSVYGLMQHYSLDPLPWRGDVALRIASTMGNSIFVAAYLIMLLPFALYRGISAADAAKRAPATANSRGMWGWIAARGLLFVATLLLFLAVLKFGTAVRVVDLRYWWVFPGALAICTALWMVPSYQPERNDGRRIVWPGLLFAGYLVFFLMTFTVSQGVQAVDSTNALVADWWIWLLGSAVCVGGYYGLAFSLPLQSGPAPRGFHVATAVAAFGLLALQITAIFFSQSRGPWIGAGAGLFVFFFLLLWQARSVAVAQARTLLAKRLGLAIGSWIAVTLAVSGFLVAFNFSNAPFFERLREVPYIGRMGELLEVDSGTGLVRRLIWIGDEHAGGAIALITADPVRALIGWGPESMFVAYNPFYPPGLAQVESRGASPDRSHQAILDELVTKGVLGLASYLYVLLSFYWFAWNWMRRSSEWLWKVFFIACIAAVTSHFVEGLTGIPIVSTLMTLWFTFAITIVGGLLSGQLVAQRAEAPVAAPEAEAPAKPAATPARQPSGRGRASAGGQRAAPRRGPAAATLKSQTSAGALAVYGIVGVVAAGAIWSFNLNPIYADMRFQQGQAASAQNDFGGLAQSMDDYLETIRGNPREDFYYLNLGRVLMGLADLQRTQGVALGEPRSDASLQQLLDLQDVTAIQGFVQANSPLGMMSYAEVVLEEARQLNPMNKDHYANLGRLNNYWFSWTRDPQRLQESLDWYVRVSEIAPQDVVLMNERAGVIIQMADYLNQQGDATAAQDFYRQAEEVLAYSRELDERYLDTDIRLGELFRLQGRDDEAVVRYIAVIERTPAQMNGVIEQISLALSDRPDLVNQLADAYAAQAARGDDLIAQASANGTTPPPAYNRGNTALLHAIAGLLRARAGNNLLAAEHYAQAIALAPENAEYNRNYTIILSDTGQYQLAAAQATTTANLLRNDPNRAAEAGQFDALALYLQNQVTP